MNRREFNDEMGFYCFEPPWFYEKYNPLIRASELNDRLEEMRDRIDNLQNIHHKHKKDEEECENKVFDIWVEVEPLMGNIELFGYVFKELSQKEWYITFWQNTAGVYWRAGEMVEEDNLNYINRQGVMVTLQDLLKYFTGAGGNPINKLHAYVEDRGREIYFDYDLPNEFEHDLYEIRDLFSLDYYSTTLLVLGRSVEKALLTLGNERKIKTLRSFGDVRKWEEARFYSRVEALKEINKPDSDEKMISRKQYHELSILVDYRNNVAHSEYEEITREEALSQIDDALRLLDDICRLIEEIRNMNDQKIDEIEGQSVS